MAPAKAPWSLRLRCCQRLAARGCPHSGHHFSNNTAPAEAPWSLHLRCWQLLAVARLSPVDTSSRTVRSGISSGVAQWLACWAHNPKVRGSKPRSAIALSNRMGRRQSHPGVRLPKGPWIETTLRYGILGLRSPTAWRRQRHPGVCACDAGSSSRWRDCPPWTQAPGRCAVTSAAESRSG